MHADIRPGTALLEAIATLTVLGMVSAAAGAMTGRELRVQQEAARHLEAMAIAEEALVEASLPAIDTEMRGDSVADFTTTRTVQAVPGIPGLCETIVVVAWRESARELHARHRC